MKLIDFGMGVDYIFRHMPNLRLKTDADHSKDSKSEAFQNILLVIGSIQELECIKIFIQIKAS